MTYLVVGLDRNTFAQWHENVRATDAATAGRIARSRARAQEIELVIAAVIGTYSSIVSLAADQRAATPKAA